MRTLLRVLVLLLTGWAVAACGQAPASATLVPPSPTPTAAALPLQMTVDGVERIDLGKSQAGAGQSWLLVRLTVKNGGSKGVTFKEQFFRLEVDGQAIPPDADAVEAAEKQAGSKGFGTALGSNLSAGEAKPGIIVFSVPNQGKSFTLALKQDDKATLEAAAPVSLTPQATRVLAEPTATATPLPTTATPRPPTLTPTLAPTKPSAPPTATPVPTSPPPPTATSMPPTVSPTPVPPTLVPTAPARNSGGVAPVSETACPADYPIKGNKQSGKYHVPTGGSYKVTKPEVCFATPQDAEAAGFTRAN